MVQRRETGPSEAIPARVHRLVYSNAQMIRIFATAFAGLLGLAFGSFLNVCLSRWPADESIVKPRSHCRTCGRALTWLENVPVLSWLVLRGRCRTCHSQIGWRYPAVELAVGLLWATIAWPFASHFTDFGIVSFSPLAMSELIVSLAGKMFLVWLFVALAVLDAEHLWLPDRLTVPGIVLGFVLRLGQAALIGSAARDIDRTAAIGYEVTQAFWSSLLAIGVCAGLILLIHWLYWIIRHREGIGLGDAKLMGMLAAWLGLSGALLAFVVGVLLGALFALVLVLRAKTRNSSEATASLKLPLGTFLCLGCTVSTLWGSQIIEGYLRWAGFN
jgi:leader peptidase (prepilin peptidase)/N-methyltransferase